MAAGVHIRYVGEDVLAIAGVGVFQRGTVAFVPSAIATRLLRDPRFHLLTDEPTTQVLRLRVSQIETPARAVVEGRDDEPADFERELEEAEKEFERT